jgi:glyoxylase I family protein
MKNIVAFNHVSLLVADTARSLDFYQGLLGLELDQARPTMDFPGAWLIVGAAQIHLLELPQMLPRVDLPEHGGRDWHFALNVSDLDKVTAALAAKGISYTLSRSGRRALFCRDPDGNAVELVEVAVGELLTK